MQEFKAAGWLTEDGEFKDGMQKMICDHVIALLDAFGEEGHSGSSAPYAIELFSKLAAFKPIAPLTGEDWEWNECRKYGSGEGFDGVYQNKRCGAVFKDSKSFDGQPYYLDAVVFWEWAEYPLGEDEEGYPGMSEPYKVYYTSSDSRRVITFPYTPVTVYEYRHSDADPKQPDQNEQGFIR